jgi:CheY-like chemotaxis protein
MTPLVLIVEDTQGLGDLLMLTLRMLHCEGRHMLNAFDALESLKDQRRPDLILLDLEMPGMNGWQFLDTMRATYVGYDAIPVIVATASVDTENKQLGEAYGIHYYMNKPYDIKLLRTLIKETLQL